MTTKQFLKEAQGQSYNPKLKLFEMNDLQPFRKADYLLIMSESGHLTM